jgi:hypothetical protein
MESDWRFDMRKQEVLDLLEQFSEELNLDQLIDTLYLKAKLEQAEAAVARGEIVSHADVAERIRKWPA